MVTLATFQVLESHMWLMTTRVESTDNKYFPHHRKFYEIVQHYSVLAKTGQDLQVLNPLLCSASLALLILESQGNFEAYIKVITFIVVPSIVHLLHNVILSIHNLQFILMPHPSCSLPSPLSSSQNIEVLSSTPFHPAFNPDY